MFRLDPSLKPLSLTRSAALLSVFQSLNEETVAFGSHQRGYAKAYIYTFEDSPENYVIEIYFDVKDEQVGYRFGYERGAVQRFRLKFLEDQALEFVEAMGFMMDNLQIQNMPAHQRMEILKALPFFEKNESLSPKSYDSISALEASGPGMDRVHRESMKQKISRLLSSF